MIDRDVTRRHFVGASAVAVLGTLFLRSKNGRLSATTSAEGPAAVSVGVDEPIVDVSNDLADVFAEPRAVTAPRAVEVIAREGWGAKRPKPWLRPHQIQRLTVHHSATKLKDNREAPSRFRRYQKIHRRKRPDIAYHLLIDRKGNVYEGRPALASGESTARRFGYDPTGHLLVMCEGNFMVQRPSRRQLNALVDVLAWASIRFGVSPDTITGHRDHAATACPGKALYAYIATGRLRDMVHQRVARGGVDLVLVEGARAKRRVASIEGRL